VLANNGDSGSPGFLAARMAFDAAGVDYPKLVAIDIDAEKLFEYQGVYQITEDQTRTVMVEDGRLYTQRMSGGRSEVLAHGEDAFFYPGGFTHLVFKRDDSGNVIGMDMFQGGNNKAESAKRVGDVAKGKGESVAVSAEVYDLWAGKYDLAPGAVLTVRRGDEQLFVQLTGQQEFEVFPLSVTRYFLKVVDAEIEFAAGDDGRAKSVTLFQNGIEQVANRIE